MSSSGVVLCISDVLRGPEGASVPHQPQIHFVGRQVAFVLRYPGSCWYRRMPFEFGYLQFKVIVVQVKLIVVQMRFSIS
jgi:hypothetical protein